MYCRFLKLVCLAALSTLLQGAALQAALVMTASGVYDEQVVRTNTIETTATPTVNGAGTVSFVTLSDFKTRITNAFANGTGGVINFDGFASAQPLTNEMQVSYGIGKTLSVTTTGNNYQIDMGALTTINATPISGDNYLRSATAIHIYNFATPLNDLGFTILGRNATRSVAVSLGYSDGSSVLLNNATIAASAQTAYNNSSLGDTFFGFTAPAGKAITSLTLTPTPSGDFFVLDDIGFVASAIPEPSTLTLGAMLFAGGCWFCQRRTRQSST
jgi:hypothetical protein